MQQHAPKHRSGQWKWTIALVLMLAATAYLVRLGSTGSWPETTCTVAGTRVVREYVAGTHRAIVMYRGEYQLRYTVGEHDYYVWANSGWSDVDKQFVQNKVDGSTGCAFRIRYNPKHPSDAVAVDK